MAWPQVRAWGSSHPRGVAPSDNVISNRVNITVVPACRQTGACVGIFFFSGRSITVVRVLWEHVVRVRFSAPRFYN